MTFRRARTAEQREIRRESIVDTALTMLGEMSVAEMSLNELSRRVGLAKPNVLRYFESREAVLLELLDRALRAWLAELSRELGAGVDPSRPAGERGDRVAALLARSLARPGVLGQLLYAQAGVLESNVSVDAVLHYKRSFLTIVETMAALVRRFLPELGDQAGAACRTTLILAGGLSAHARPCGNVLAAFEEDPALAPLRVDLAAALESAVTALLAGILAGAAARA